MLISKQLDLNNDTHRLLISMVFVTMSLMLVSSNSKSQLSFLFKNRTNSLYSENTPNSYDNVNQQASSRGAYTNLNLLTQKKSSVQVSISNSVFAHEAESNAPHTESGHADSLDTNENEVERKAENSAANTASQQSTLVSGALASHLVYQSLLVGSPPNYIYQARKHELEGLVVAKIQVDKQGVIEQTELVKSSGHALLDNEVRRAISMWIFDPHTIGFEKKEFVIEFNFKLE